MYVLVIVAIILCFLFKLLNVNNSPERSIFYCENKKFLEQILKSAPSLNDPYGPTRLWGFSGHVQTIVQGLISRLYCPLVTGRRYFFRAPDGATVTYDLYMPISDNKDGGDVTLAICPGIANSSESIYIRRVVFHARNQGFNVAVLNHVGALKSVKVTSPRIFNYGNTQDYHGMLQDLAKRYPNTKFVCLGFSMGGNLITKYLGEEKRSSKILAGISVCQGYDAVETTKNLLMWEGFRRLYLFAMTENMRGILRRWQKQLFTDKVKQEYDINERSVWSAATMVEVDEAYTRKLLKFDTVEEMYRNMSCMNYWSGIDKPMIFINAVDDPIVPPVLLNKVKEATKTNHNFLYIEQKYGGHLGFYEGGYILPNPLTWLDRTVVDLGLALAEYTNNEKSDLLDTTDDDFELNSDDEMNSLLNFKFESAPLCKEDAGNPKKAQIVKKSVVHKLPRLSDSKSIVFEPKSYLKQLSVKE